MLNALLSSLRNNNRSPRPTYPRVELFYWNPPQGAMNFGDYLSHVIVCKHLADCGRFLDEETLRARRLLAIGSILHFAHDGDVIWGSGVNGKIDAEAHRFRTLDVRAVRGPLTREFLTRRGIEAPEVYGDPALLLPRLFGERFKATRGRAHVFVPNLHDITLTTGWEDVVSPSLPWNTCIDRILNAEFVMASSLHGLIVAEAFGIPARYVRLSETEGIFKYRDYALGTGRAQFEFARSREEALEMGGMAPPSFDAAALLDAFPLDLWTGSPKTAATTG